MGALRPLAAMAFCLALAPAALAQDANDNLSEVLADELGLVKAFAVFGKGSEADNLTGLNNFTTAAETTQEQDEK